MLYCDQLLIHKYLFAYNTSEKTQVGPVGLWEQSKNVGKLNQIKILRLKIGQSFQRQYENIFCLKSNVQINVLIVFSTHCVLHSRFQYKAEILNVAMITWCGWHPNSINNIPKLSPAYSSLTSSMLHRSSPTIPKWHLPVSYYS